MIVTISGLPGAGKTTVGKMLAKKLRCRFYSMGGIRRAAARERGLTLEQFNALGEKKEFTDKYFDQWQAKLGRRMKRGVIEGRTSFHFIPHSIKIFLKVNAEAGARRIWHDTAAHRRFEADFSNLTSVKQALKRRIASDRLRYRKYYRLNIFEPRHYDLILDTTRLKPIQVVGRIAKFLNQVEKETVDKRIPQTQPALSSNSHLTKRKKK